MTDFVYVYSRIGAVGDELATSIKSVRKFFQGPHRIFVVGDPPKIPGVIHIPAERTFNTRFPKAIDAAKKLHVIATHADIAEEFVYFYDDIVILRPVKRADFEVVRAVDLVKDPNQYWQDKPKPSAVWRTIFLNTINTLKQHHLPTWNYETHLPRLFAKTKVKEVLEHYQLLTVPHLFATLYFNHYHLAPYQTLSEDETIKSGLYAPHERRWIEEHLPGTLFLNYDNCGYTDSLKDYLKKLLT